jgi:hypothetical protein
MEYKTGDLVPIVQNGAEWQAGTYKIGNSIGGGCWQILDENDEVIFSCHESFFLTAEGEMYSKRRERLIKLFTVMMGSLTEEQLLAIKSFTDI